MPEQLEELFADLRAETLPRVRPPGTDAARHTVRRRRTTRTVTAAVALVVAGGLVATGLPGTGGHRVSPAERMRELVDAAKRALDTELPDLAGRALSGTVEPGGQLVFAQMAPGSYTLALTCAGPGTVTVNAELVRSAQESSALGGQVVSCAEAPRAAVMTFRLPVKGQVTISADGDTQAAGNAAYALEVADGDGSGRQSVPDARSTWNAARAADALRGADAVYTRRASSGEGTTEQFFAGPGAELPAGEYYFEFVCAGPGTVALTVLAAPVSNGPAADTGSELMSGQIECSDTDPHRSDSIDILTLPKRSSFLISAVPDQAARNRAGWAYKFSPA